METLRKIIEEKKRKGEEKKPYYGIRKLSVGIVSCMLGHLLFFASPVVVSAVEATPEDVSIIQMQSVKGEAIERSATLVAVTGATGIRAASGNIDSENLGYAPNAKSTESTILPLQQITGRSIFKSMKESQNM